MQSVCLLRCPYLYECYCVTYQKRRHRGLLPDKKIPKHRILTVVSTIETELLLLHARMVYVVETQVANKWHR